MATLELAQGRLEVLDEGPADGAPVVLVHGFMVDERLWAPIVPALLAAGHRVIRPTLPIGAHRVPLGAEPTLTTVVELVAGLLAHLDLRDVTLVGNDSGGALCQMLVAEHPERVGRLVLTNCDTVGNFPPFPFDWMFLRLAKHGRAMHAAMRLGGATGGLRALFGLLSARGLERTLVDSWVAPYLTDRTVQAETDAFLRSFDDALLERADDRNRSLALPVLLVWGADDRFFTLGHARGLAGRLPHATLVEVPGARTFVTLDQPARVAAEIIAFASARLPAPR